MDKIHSVTILHNGLYLAENADGSGMYTYSEEQVMTWVQKHIGGVSAAVRAFWYSVSCCGADRSENLVWIFSASWAKIRAHILEKITEFAVSADSKTVNIKFRASNTPIDYKWEWDCGLLADADVRKTVDEVTRELRKLSDEEIVDLFAALYKRRERIDTEVWRSFIEVIVEGKQAVSLDDPEIKNLLACGAAAGATFTAPRLKAVQN